MVIHTGFRQGKVFSVFLKFALKERWKAYKHTILKYKTNSPTRKQASKQARKKTSARKRPPRSSLRWPEGELFNFEHARLALDVPTHSFWLQWWSRNFISLRCWLNGVGTWSSLTTQKIWACTHTCIPTHPLTHAPPPPKHTRTSMFWLVNILWFLLLGLMMEILRQMQIGAK